MVPKDVKAQLEYSGKGVRTIKTTTQLNQQKYSEESWKPQRLDITQTFS